MLMHNIHAELSLYTFNLSLYSKIKTLKNWERLLLLRKSLYDKEIKQQNKVFIDIRTVKWMNFFCPFLCTFCTLAVLFVYYLFWTFSPWKMLLSCQNKVFRTDLNYFKEIQLNCKSFVIVRDKKFHVEIRVFLMTCLFDLSLMCLFDLVSNMLSLVSFCYNNYKRDR